MERELSSVSTIIMGISPSGDTYNKNGVGLPLLNGPTEFGTAYPTCTLFTTASSKECEEGDLIFCVRASIGRMNWADKVYSLGRGVCAIRGETDLDTKFIRYCIENNLQSLLNFAGGGTFPNLTKESIFTFKIPYPDNRHKIADILSTYDNLIENNTRRSRILEEMAQVVYQEWFGKVDNESMPKGWSMTTLGKVCNIVMGQSPSSEFYNGDGKGLPFHQGVTNFGDRFPTDKIFCTAENRIAEKGDVLFSVRAPVGRLNISTKKIIIGRGLCAIRSKTGNQSFVFQQLKEQFHEDDMMGGGTIFKSVTKDDVHGIKFLLPSKDITEKFETFANPISRELEILTAKNANLRQTRDLLLPRLVSGEIEV